MSDNILITGIAGSGASYLAEYLHANVTNINIHGIARWHTDSSSHPNLSKIKKDVTIHGCDLTDLSSVVRTLEKSSPKYIFNMASNANVRMSFEYPMSIFENNVKSTFNLLEACRITHQRPIIHQCSTSEVYGQVKIEDTPITENQKIDPINVYAISKFAQEKLMKSYFLSYNIPVVLTRAFSYINPRRPDIFSSAFAKQVVNIENGNQKTIKCGNLDSTRTLIDVRDICEAYWLSVLHCKYGEEYNIGGTDKITVGEFLNELIMHSKTNVTYEQDPTLIRPVDVTMQIPDVSKFQAITNWKPKYTLSESIEFLLEYYRHTV